MNGAFTRDRGVHGGHDLSPTCAGHGPCSYPANPVEAAPIDVLASLLGEDRAAGFTVEDGGTAWPLTSDHGLHGLATRVRGRFPGRPEQTKALVAAHDGRHLYTLQLDVAGADPRPYLEAFDAVARSARPLPRPRPPASPRAVHEHWTC